MIITLEYQNQGSTQTTSRGRGGYLAALRYMSRSQSLTPGVHTSSSLCVCVCRLGAERTCSSGSLACTQHTETACLVSPSSRVQTAHSALPRTDGSPEDLPMQACQAFKCGVCGTCLLKMPLTRLGNTCISNNHVIVFGHLLFVY